MFVTKADLKLLAITAVGGALAILIASLFEKSRAFMWRFSMLPIPLALALIILIAIVVPLLLVARNRNHQILNLEKELSEIKANAQKQDIDRKKRYAAQQTRAAQNRPRGGFVRNW